MHLTAVIGAVSVATSCFLSTDSETGRVVGIISTDDDVPTIEAPDTVRAGDTFDAVVNTFGSSSCTTPDGVKLTLEPAEVRVTPFDRVPTDDDLVCTRDISPLPHPVQLHFTQPGSVRIVAAGMVIDEKSGDRVPAEVSKAVLVKP